MPSDLESTLRRIRDDLDALERPWALVGALAVAAYSEARATLDVDVAMAVERTKDSAKVVEEMVRRGYIWQASFGTAMVALGIPDARPAGLRLDLLFSLAGIEDEVARNGSRLSIVEGSELPVARRGDLIALKLLSAQEPEREHDWRDLRALVSSAEPTDIERARRSIALLVARGRTPDGVLDAELDDLLARDR